MNNCIKKIDVKPGLNDSNLETYVYVAKDNSLKILVRTWNNKLVEFLFSDVLHFTDYGCQELKKICQVLDEKILLKKILELKFTDLPGDHSYRHFQFYDENDNVTLEVISETFEYVNKG